MASRDEEEQGSQGVKVIDRRRFNSEGDERAETEETTRPRTEAAPQKKAPETPRPSAPATQQTKGGEEEEQADFSSLLVGLATQAFVFLGEAPDPATGGSRVNLDAARHTIDILGVLQEKTKGNLSAEEEKLLSDLVTNLRFMFVKVANEKR